MSSIYELNKDYAELSAMLEAAETSEEIEAIQNTLEMLDCSIEEKIENTAMYMVNVESDIDFTKVEIKADKTAIKKAIKAGETVEGAEIKVNQNFYIK